MQNPTLTTMELEAMISEFCSSIGDGTYASKGWPKSMYGVSKMAVSTLVNIYQRDKSQGKTFYSMCPGWVRANLFN